MRAECVGVGCKQVAEFDEALFQHGGWALDEFDNIYCPDCISKLQGLEDERASEEEVALFNSKIEEIVKKDAVLLDKKKKNK